MRILVLNSGSSSLKFSLFDSGEAGPRTLDNGEVTGIGSERSEFKLRDAEGRDLRAGKPALSGGVGPVEATGLVMEAVCAAGMPAVEAVGYRMVHPGAKLDRHQLITPEVMQDIEESVPFGPLHNPPAIAIIREMRKRLPDVPHYVNFDTVFHETMPEVATTYAVPEEFRKLGVRRYGFHGLACESVVRQLRESRAGVPRRLIIAHLGSGCSVTAVLDGRSIDTTMGLTACGGVVMGTRPGDLDPGLMFFLLRQMEGDRPTAAKTLETILNQKSGMVALSGLPNDMKVVREVAETGDARARLAVEVFTRSVKKAVGGFVALMGGVDAVAFSGGIGEHDVRTREEVLSGLEGMGIVVDAALNEERRRGMRRISAAESKAGVFVVPANEDLMIAMHVEWMARAEELASVG